MQLFVALTALLVSSKSSAFVVSRPSSNRAAASIAAGSASALRVLKNQKEEQTKMPSAQQEQEPAVHGFVKRQYGRYVTEGGDGEGVFKSRATNVGYDVEFLKECGLNFEKTSVPQLFTASCGSGCPLRLAPEGVKKGDTVLDLGCGAGHDVVLASRMVGKDGKVLGLDMTKEMIAAAKKHVDLYAGDETQCGQVDFVCAPMDLSFSESTLEVNFADFVISNGAINLCHDKKAVFDAAYNALKPGGWFLLSDACRVEKNPNAAVACSIGDSYTN